LARPFPGREFHPLKAPGLAWRTEISFDVRRQFKGFEEFQGSGVLGLPCYFQNGKDHRQDQKPFLHLLSMPKQFGFWSTRIARAGAQVQRELRRGAASGENNSSASRTNLNQD